MTTKNQELRGAELAEEVLRRIEDEQRILNGHTRSQVIGKTNVWDQARWASIDMNSLPKDTTIMPIDEVTVPGYERPYWEDSELAALDAGVSCGTAMCFAGHASTIAGDRLVVRVDRQVADTLKTGKTFKKARNWFKRVSKKANSPYIVDADIAKVLTTDGRIMTISDRARELLDLTDTEANKLFGAANGIEDIRKYTKRIIDGKHVSSGRKKNK